MPWTFNPFTTKLDYYQEAASSGGVSGDGVNFVIVENTEDVLTNGSNLLSAYTEAKALTPNGVALSSTNRATVLLPPAVYDLDTGYITLDTQYVDIVGLSDCYSNTIITSSMTTSLVGTVTQDADNIVIQGITIKNTGSYSPASDGPCAYYPTAGFSSCIIRNCYITDSNDSACRIGGEYSGRYENVKTSNGGWQGTCPGTFIDCESEDKSFAYNPFANVDASGTFTNCEGGNKCFGSAESNNGIASGKFTNCIAQDYSFGSSQLGNALFSGNSMNCKAGVYSFGSSVGGDGTISGYIKSGYTGDSSYAAATGVGTISGTIEDCHGGAYCFTSNFGNISGVIKNCTSGIDSFFANGILSGTIEDCRGTTRCFGGYEGTISGTGVIKNCTGGANCFTGEPYGGIAGLLINCTGGANSFSADNSGAICFCKLTSGSFPVPVGGVTRYCLNGDNSTDNQG